MRRNNIEQRNRKVIEPDQQYELTPAQDKFLKHLFHGFDQRTLIDPQQLKTESQSNFKKRLGHILKFPELSLGIFKDVNMVELSEMLKEAPLSGSNQFVLIDLDQVFPINNLLESIQKYLPIDDIDEEQKIIYEQTKLSKNHFHDLLKPNQRINMPVSLALIDFINHLNKKLMASGEEPIQVPAINDQQLRIIVVGVSEKSLPGGKSQSTNNFQPQSMIFWVDKYFKPKTSRPAITEGFRSGPFARPSYP